MTVTLEKGQAASQFVHRLQTADEISPYMAWHLKVYFRLKRIDRILKAGEYHVTAGTKPLQFVNQLEKGEVIQHKIVLIEGWTFKEIRAALNAEPLLEKKLSTKTNEEIMAALGEAGSSPEGRFFPDTYFFSKTHSDQDILKRAMDKMDDYLNALWEKRSERVVFNSPYEGLILASLIEKEAGMYSERPKVSGVLQNRLKKGMRLQCDPTVIYGLQENFTGDLTRNDLKVDTPYNTYLHKGLPPTPIAAPGFNALDAAFYPAETDALYFVAKGDGSHVFSTTLEAHDRAVERLNLGGVSE